MESTSFIDELLAEAESAECRLTLAHYDLLILEYSKLQDEITRNFEEAEREKQIIHEWAIQRNSKIQDKADYILRKLEAYIREEGKKTIDLPHGILKIRKRPDKVEIDNLDAFLSEASGSFVQIIPEQLKPDLNKIKAYIKQTGAIPAGVNYIIGEEDFSLKLNKEN